MRALLLFYSLLLSGAIFATDFSHITVNLNSPEYRDGTLSTHQGGVITTSDMRIQARYITYIDKVEKKQPVQKVIAEGDLMLDHADQIYVGRRLEYDFITKTGIIYEGVSAINLWFVGGENIRLSSDRSIYLYNAFMTSSENKKADWKIQTRELEINKKCLLTAKSITVKIFETPIFWFPTFKSNLKAFTDSPIRYQIDWDQGFWPKLSMRYRIYSWELLDLFLRLNVRTSHKTRGIGGAIESNYRSLDKRTKFQTKSYIDHDGFYFDTNPEKARFHYRLQGLYKAESQDRNSELYITYDKLSDKNMQSHFKTDNFEVSTVKQTLLKMRHTRDSMIFGINARPRINSFQGLKQELPGSFWTFHPFKIGKTEVITENRFKASYLNYVSAKDIEPAIPDFHSTRLSTHNELYLPINWRGVSLTPLAGFKGIFYNESRRGGSAMQAVFNLETFLSLTLRKQYQSSRHLLQPYMHYRGLSHPKLSPDTPYIFSINDGFNHLRELQSGVRSLLYLKQYPLFEPNFIADLYLYAFFSDETWKKTIPKMHGLFTWNFPSVTLNSHIGWNMEKQVLDFANVGLAWTINKNFAFKTEFRHRGPFDWRRSNDENYIMEVTREIPKLLHSPLSDKRSTFLTRLQVKIAPQWTARVESQIGWGRSGEPHYTEARVELLTRIASSWKLRLIFTHSPAPEQKNAFLSSHNRFSLAFSLVSK